MNPERWRTTALALATAGLAALLVLIGLRIVADGASTVDAPEVATASSATLGHPAANALQDSDGPSGWQPEGDPVGSWWQMRWHRPVRISMLSIEQPVSGGTATRVMLSFGDGSRLMAGLDRGRSEIAFAPRSADSVRVVLVATGGDARAVRLLQVSAANRVDAGTPIASDPTRQGIASVAAITDGATVVRALTDGDASGGLGADWGASGAGTRALTLRWTRPHEIDAVELYGAASTDGRVLRGVIDFGGDRIRIGGVLADPSRPTQVAFVPRVVTTLRIELVAAVGSEAVRLAELRVLSPGSVLTAPDATSGSQLAAADTQPSTCGDAEEVADGPSTEVELRCPAAGSAVRGRTTIVVSAPARATLTAEAWGNDGASPERATVERSGRSTTLRSIEFDAAALAAGPLTISIEVGGTTPAVRLGFYNVSTTLPPTRVDSRSAIGGKLVYSQEFDGPVTVARDGAGGAYTAAKPEVKGVSDFGDAPFADPASANSTLSTAGGSLLRLDVRAQTGAAGKHWGAMLASSRAGGSGFSAQYGYFEARMYVPIATGSWPAFWLLPASNLAKAQEDVAEFDAVELYGHNPVSACSSTHHYHGTDTPGGVASCGQRFPTARDAAEWHTYGVRVDPDGVIFFIDGEQVAAAAQVPGGAEPLFFLVDLALGGGWPVDLKPQGGNLQMYVDFVRVYE